MTSAPAMDPDGGPVWSVRSGSRLVDGHLAWRRLAVGHRCETWLAWSTERWAPAVVKIARPHQVEHPRAQLALSREAEALTNHPHPHLPLLLEDRRGQCPPHLITEYIDGPALDELLEDTGDGLTTDEVAALAAQLAGVLRWLHRRGLAHLDLTPANVLVREGVPMLIDLGAALPLGRRQPRGAPIGSAGYAAPELEAGDPIAASMDLYGLGVTLYEALTGEPAFHPDCLPIHRPHPTTLTMPDGPLADLVRDLLDPDPGHRPPDTDAVLRALPGPSASLMMWPRFATRHLRGVRRA